MLLSTAYFPPLSWFALAAGSPVVQLEAFEHYTKQTWRNRCAIMTAGGRETLHVPVVHSGGKVPIREVRIEYLTPWVVRTERTIDSAYRSSAWFDYYRDSLYYILESGEEYLFDLNLNIINYFLQKTGIPTAVVPTTEWTPQGGGDDWREALHPKREDTVLRDMGLEKPYFQVFSGKYGFVPNLSVMDLLFNEGPESVFYLRKP